MADIQVYLYTSCTSCRKAEEVLKSRGVAYDRRDYFKRRFSRDELASVLRGAGLTPHEVLSTRSTPFRELGLAQRTLSDDELLDLMVDHPQLLRRPLIVRGGQSTTGYNASAIEALIEG